MFRARFLKQLGACALGMLAAVGAATAQVRDFDIPQGDLKSALDAYAQQTGLQIIYRSEDVRGVTTAGVHGALDAADALKNLLAKTGFRVVRESNGAIAIVKGAPRNARTVGKDRTSAADRSGNAKTLDTVTVTATAEGYAATRVPTELREIPQSVSVMSQELLQQQNDFSLADALNWTTGITVQAIGTKNTVFYSRGFGVTGYHVDGGAQLLISNGAPIDDMSEYDRVEVLRGADGLFGGFNSPGATVNLVRKQPLATPEANLSATLGSWDFYHLGLDATGPLGFGGALRGRVAVSNTEQHYFYDTANSRTHKLYGVLAYDLGPSTTLTVGGSVKQAGSTGMTSGLPRYTTGADAHLPRSQGLVFPQSHDAEHTTEAFVGLTHDFGGGWKLKADLARVHGKGGVLEWDPPYSGINPATDLIKGLPLESSSAGSSSQITADATLTGGFDWRGRRQDVALGADYARLASHSSFSNGTPLGPPALDPWRFDPTAYTLAPAGPTNPYFLMDGSGVTRIGGVYAVLRLRPWDKWSVTLGARDNYYRLRDVTTVALDFGSRRQSLSPYKSATVSTGVVTPYAGIVYDISKQYSLYASYVDVFRPAGNTITAAGNPIPPVHGVNLEAGIKAAWNHGLLNGSLALFKIHQDNVALFDPNHPFRRVGGNSCCYLPGTNTSKGVEAELSGQLTSRWLWSAGYTFNVNRSATLTGAAPPLASFAPKHLLKLWTDYRLPGAGERWSLGGGVLAQSASYLTDSVCASSDAFGRCQVPYQKAKITQGFYTVVTLRAAYRIDDHWSMALNVNNLFDRTYYQTIGHVGSGNVYGTPRSFMLTINGSL